MAHPSCNVELADAWASAGARWPMPYAPLGVGVGAAKALLGLGLRPVSGTLEALSKSLQGAGLLCLGKRGIQGKLVRRVRAPGVAVADILQVWFATMRWRTHISSSLSAALSRCMG